MDDSAADIEPFSDFSPSLSAAIGWLNRDRIVPSWMPPFPDRSEGAEFGRRLREWLRSVEARRPPPPPIRVDDEDDARIGGFIDDVRASLAGVRRAVAKSLNDRAADRLAGFAGRAATRAVRTGDPNVLRRAVVALALAYRASHDWRDVLIYYPLPYDAARRLGLDPDELFLDAAEYSSETGAQSLRDFVKRPEGAKTLAAMEFRVGADADGFRYERGARPW